MNNPKVPTDDGRVRKYLDGCEGKLGEKSVAFVR